MTQIIPTRIRHAGQQYSYSLENDMNDQAADREERKREVTFTRNILVDVQAHKYH